MLHLILLVIGVILGIAGVFRLVERDWFGAVVLIVIALICLGFIGVF